jgi:hypothetical protein
VGQGAKNSKIWARIRLHKLGGSEALEARAKRRLEGRESDACPTQQQTKQRSSRGAFVAIALHQRDDAACSVRKQLVISRAELLSNAANCMSIPFALD